jgi:hypothetical protein
MCLAALYFKLSWAKRALMQQAATRPMAAAAAAAEALSGYKDKPTSHLLPQVVVVALALPTMGRPIIMEKTGLPPIPEAEAEATMPLAMRLEVPPDKMDMAVRGEEKVGYLSFKIRQGNWLQTMGAMVDMGVGVAVAQAAAAILCMLLGPEGDTPAVGQEVLPITMVGEAEDPTTPVQTLPPPEGFKVVTDKLLLLGRG